MPHSLSALILLALLAMFPHVAISQALCNSSPENQVNLLASKPQQRIIAASSRQWSSVMANNDSELSGLALDASTAHSVLFGFPEEKWAKLTCLRIELPTYDADKLIPRVALSIAQEQPTEAFRLLGVYPANPDNIADGYLQLPLDNVVARFLRVQILTPSDTDLTTKIGQFQLLGKSLIESEPPPRPKNKHRDTNLIGFAEGGRLTEDTDTLWQGVMDGREAFTGPFPLNGQATATIALAEGQKTLTGFSVYIPQASTYNLARVEILAGQPKDGELQLESLGTFEIANLRFFDNPMQYFPLPETAATHVRFVPLASHGAEALYIRELRVHGY